ncbi:MAG: SDR family NAD(P)-dependent oxidoreductase [Candidatus Omnitrophica bacterium]|nr:SDR family NAD(P)-dependent oxidoreductase [Candidatus Omnitrophota bacterium]
MKKVLVTGGAGFIGSHIVDRLVFENYEVVVIDDFSSGRIENLKSSINKIKLIKGDIRNDKLIKRLLKRTDYVLHQAALRSVPKSVKYPLRYNEVNVTATLNLLKRSAEAGVKRFVFASSSSVYGESSKPKQKETDLPLLISPYAATKLAGEYYCRVFSKIYSLQTVSLRYFNVFGPRQSLESQYAVVVPKFIACLLKAERPPIHGTGKQSRDFTYIDNVVEANILAMKRKGVSGCVFNIACGKTQSVNTLFSQIKTILNSKVNPIFTELRAGDVARTCADISQAQRLLRFKVGVEFNDGLKRAIKWFQEKK